MPKKPAHITADHPDDATIDAACSVLVSWMRLLDPIYRDRIDSTLDERRWTTRQLCGAVLGSALDRGTIMDVPTHHYFEPGAILTSENMTCPNCGETYSPRYMGQVHCAASRAPVMPHDMAVPEAALPPAELEGESPEL
jgi:hypothetical protein